MPLETDYFEPQQDEQAVTLQELHQQRYFELEDKILLIDEQFAELECSPLAQAYEQGLVALERQNLEPLELARLNCTLDFWIAKLGSS